MSNMIFNYDLCLDTEIEIDYDLYFKFPDHQNRANYLYFDEILNGCSLVEDACNGITPYLDYFFNGESACIITHGVTGKNNCIIVYCNCIYFI